MPSSTPTIGPTKDTEAPTILTDTPTTSPTINWNIIPQFSNDYTEIYIRILNDMDHAILVENVCELMFDTETVNIVGNDAICKLNIHNEHDYDILISLKSESIIQLNDSLTILPNILKIQV